LAGFFALDLSRPQFAHRRRYSNATPPAAQQLLELSGKINYLSRIAVKIKGLVCCLKFKQNVSKLRLTVIRDSSAQFFNKVIHRFRGYMK
jgi:hypothetical protein